MRILTVDLTARSRRTDEPVPPGWAADDLLIEAVRPSELAWACADLQPEAVVVTTDSAGRADAFLVRSLREDEVGVPVLVIAAEADGESLAASLEAGADDVVPSPSTPIEIRARLRALLWTALDRPPPAVQRRTAPDARGRRYLEALQ